MRYIEGGRIWNRRVRELRAQSGMTLKEVAKAIGTTEATAQRYETGKGIQTIPILTVLEYAKLFHVHPGYIMGWEDSRSNYLDPVVQAVADRMADPEFHELVEIIRDLSPEDVALATALLKRLVKKDS